MNGDEEVLARLQIIEKELQEKLDRLRKPIAQAEEELQHVIGTIAVLRRGIRPTIAQDTPAEDGLSLIAKLKGMTQMNAIVAIARSRGGVIRAQDAKKIMIEARIMRSTKNATNMTHNVFARSDSFERIGPGEYRLKDSGQQSGKGLQGYSSEDGPRRLLVPVQ